MTVTKGDRVGSVSEIIRPGDYFLNPEPGADGRSLWFCLPVDDPSGARGSYLHRITEPPWTFRECEDGSVEVRASILTYKYPPTEPLVEHWHGFLDEGHLWRQV